MWKVGGWLVAGWVWGIHTLLYYITFIAELLLCIAGARCCCCCSTLPLEQRNERTWFCDNKKIIIIIILMVASHFPLRILCVCIFILNWISLSHGLDWLYMSVYGCTPLYVKKDENKSAWNDYVFSLQHPCSRVVLFPFLAFHFRHFHAGVCVHSRWIAVCTTHTHTHITRENEHQWKWIFQWKWFFFLFSLFPCLLFFFLVASSIISLYAYIWMNKFSCMCVCVCFAALYGHLCCIFCVDFVLDTDAASVHHAYLYCR